RTSPPAARSPSSAQTSTTAGRSPSCLSPSSKATSSRARIDPVGAGSVRIPASGFRHSAWCLLDDSAGDAIAGIAGRVGHVVVLARVHHHRRAAVLEHGVGLALLERDLLDDDLLRQVSALGDTNIVHVAGVMAFLVELAVLLLLGIEMGT